MLEVLFSSYIYSFYIYYTLLLVYLLLIKPGTSCITSSVYSNYFPYKTCSTTTHRDPAHPRSYSPLLVLLVLSTHLVVLSSLSIYSIITRIRVKSLGNSSLSLTTSNTIVSYHLWSIVLKLLLLSTTSSSNFMAKS